MSAEEEVDPRTPLLQVGDEVPNFTCATTTINNMTFHDQLDSKWTMLLTLPKNLDPVAVSEVATVNRMRSEFESRDMNVFVVGVDTKMNHKAWLTDVLELTEEQIQFPIIVDEQAFISKAFGLVRADETELLRHLVPVMLVVLIDPDLRIQLLLHYPVNTGHNFFEVLRVVDSAAIAAKHEVCTPANWLSGEDIFIRPDVSTVDAEESFEKGFLEIRPWFRITPVPEDEDQAQLALGDENSVVTPSTYGM